MRYPRLCAGRIQRRATAILRRLSDGVPLVGVEVGVFDGQLSSLLLQSHPQLTLYMVDLWEEPPEIHVRRPHCTARHWRRIREQASDRVAFAGGRAILMPAESSQAAQRFTDASLDFAFIDDDHSFAGCTRSITAWFSKVKPGGWVCGHDYHRNWPRVKMAVHGFFDPRTLPIKLGANTTWFVRIPEVA